MCKLFGILNPVMPLLINAFYKRLPRSQSNFMSQLKLPKGKGLEGELGIYSMDTLIQIPQISLEHPVETCQLLITWQVLQYSSKCPSQVVVRIAAVPGHLSSLCGCEEKLENVTNVHPKETSSSDQKRIPKIKFQIMIFKPISRFPSAQLMLFDC